MDENNTPTIEVPAEAPGLNTESVAETAALLKSNAELLAPTIEAEKKALGHVDNPVGVQDPSHRVYWHGRNEVGTNFIGSAPDTKKAIDQAIAAGSATCHTSVNPSWKEKAPDTLPALQSGQALLLAARASEIQSEMEAREKEQYDLGWQDANAAYLDLKNLVQVWATEQALAGADLDHVPMVVYIRNNR